MPKVILTEQLKLLDLNNTTNYLTQAHGGSGVTSKEALKQLIQDYIPNDSQYLTFSCQNSEFTLACKYPEIKTYAGILEYSTDTFNWTEWNRNTITSINKQLFLRGKNNTTLGLYVSNYPTNFILTPNTSSAKIFCKGNIEVLLNWELVVQGGHPFMENGAFYKLFNNNTSLITSPDLPAIQLATQCYREMFSGCNNLIRGPKEIKATTFPISCCEEMFRNCSELLYIPSFSERFQPLDYCCHAMYAECTKLNVLPQINITYFNSSSFAEMFQNCLNIKLSETQTSTYNTPYYCIDIYNKESEYPEGNSAFIYRMFYNTGGSYTGDGKAGHIYYTSNEVI